MLGDVSTVAEVCHFLFLIFLLCQSGTDEEEEESGPFGRPGALTEEAATDREGDQEDGEEKSRSEADRGVGSGPRAANEPRVSAPFRPS